MPLENFVLTKRSNCTHTGVRQYVTPNNGTFSHIIAPEFKCIGDNRMKRLLATLAIPFILSACGSDNASDAYTFDLQLGEVKEGVADINITVTSNDDSELPNSNIKVYPLMLMASGIEHGTPFENATGQLEEDGTFTSTAYFLMPSNMPSGMAMGDWSITVEFDGQSQIFPITVDMGTSDVKTLKGSDNDQIMAMGDSSSTTDRTYYFYNRGRHINAEMSMNAFEIYVAARESMMDYQAISVGNILNEGSMYELNIASVIVDMCTSNCDIEGSWKTAVEDPDYPGIYKASELGLVNDETDSVMVRLTVDNELKDDGTLASNENTPSTSVMFSFDDSTDDSSMNHEM